MKEYIKIHENDNVIVALKEIAKGETVFADQREIEALEVIPAGHKWLSAGFRKAARS